MSTPNASQDRLLKASEAAAILSCSSRAIWRMRANGTLPAIRVPGAGTRFKLSDVHRLMRHSTDEVQS